MAVVTPAQCTRKCSLTIDHTKVLETGYYPVLFDGSGDSGSFGTRLPDELFTLSQSNGGDICFASDSAGTTQLPVELVTIDTTNKKAEIWVKVNLASLSADTVIYVFYQSNSGTLTQPAANATYGSQNVWSNNYQNVYHLPASGSNVSGADSTSSVHNVDASYCPTGAGHIGAGIYFDGSHYLNMLAISIPQSAGSISFWWKPEDVYSFNAPEAFRAYNSSGRYFDGLTAYNGILYGGWYNNSTDNRLTYSESNFSNGTYYYITLTWTSGGYTYLYVNNNTTPVASYANTTEMWDTTTGTTWLGRYPDGSQAFSTSYIDEWRTSTSQRSGNYNATDYNIQTSTSLVTVGTPTNTATFTYKGTELAAAEYGGGEYH